MSAADENQGPDDGGQRPAGETVRARRRGRAFGGALSVSVHALVFAALFAAWPKAPSREPPPIQVTMVALGEQNSPKPAGQPQPPKPVARASHVRPTPAPKAPVELASGPPSPVPAVDVLSDAEVAGATSGDSGPPGGACDMARALQRAFRRDKLVQNAVLETNRPGKAIRVWNGDWVQSGGQDGKGLAAVREAMLWEIAFAPPACRAQQVHGMILLSVSDAPGSARLAVGMGEWRWSDLLRSVAAR